jgi:predicted RNA-binding Zn ribbon-like protein
MVSKDLGKSSQIYAKAGRQDPKGTAEDHLLLVGGRIAVDFANTASQARASAEEADGWGRLVAFLMATGSISMARRDALVNLEQIAPEATAELVEKAMDLRSAIRQILKSRASRAPLNPDWIKQINTILAFTEGYDRLEPVGEVHGHEPSWRLQLAARSDGLEWLIAAIARSAAEIVAEGATAPVRKCANPKCDLHFYDNSRTHKRKWCSMATCGNRSKVAAHFRRRTRATPSGEKFNRPIGKKG